MAMGVLAPVDFGTLILTFTSMTYCLNILAEWNYGTNLCGHLPRDVWPGPS